MDVDQAEAIKERGVVLARAMGTVRHPTANRLLKHETGASYGYFPVLAVRFLSDWRFAGVDVVSSGWVVVDTRRSSRSPVAHSLASRRPFASRSPSRA